MLKILKALEKTVIAFTKFLMILIAFGIFYSFFIYLSPELQRISRVSTITASTFLVLSYIMFTLYGVSFSQNKSTREIASSVIFALIITDLFSYIQLCIMEKRIMPFGLIILIIILQISVSLSMVKYINRLYYHLNPPLNLLIVTTDTLSKDIYREIFSHYKHRFKVNNFIDPYDKTLLSQIDINDGVLLCHLSPNRKSEIISYCYKIGKAVFIQPDITDIVINNCVHDIFDDTPVFINKPPELSFEEKFMKRTFDIIFSLVTLLLTLPLVIIVTVMIKIQDGGCIFYKQQRSTINGRQFNLVKFRTMIENAEQKTGAILSGTNDTRITRIGKFLRKTRLDELPQLYNILKGDMSVIGPRPEREIIADKYKETLPEFDYRLRVKAGLTGYAQILGKYSTSPKDKLILDLLYIENYSLLLDIKILLRTLQVIITPEKST